MMKDKLAADLIAELQALRVLIESWMMQQRERVDRVEVVVKAAKPRRKRRSNRLPVIR